MKCVNTIARIRREFFAAGKTIKQIVRELHVSRNTVSEVVRTGAPAFEHDREPAAPADRPPASKEKKAAQEHLT